MILFPAIDLKDGACVRLEQGDMARATVFHRDPAAQARAFEAQGFAYLHVVDLDGAFSGKPVNVAAVESIIDATTLPLQLGGGIRDIDTIEAWLHKGVTRVIIGTAAVRDPALVTKAARLYPARVAVALDARDGMVAVKGWAETSELTALDVARRFEDVGVAALIYTDIARDGLLKGLNLEATIALDARDGMVAVKGWAETSELTALDVARRFEDVGVAALIYTDISRDGLLKGLNLDATVALAEAVSIPVIASGGLASIADVEALLHPRARKIAGAIAGRALYDGRLDPAAALALIRAAAPGAG